MAIDYDRLLASVVRITGERERKSLGEALVKGLCELLPVDALILLQVPRIPEDDYLEVVACAPPSALSRLPQALSRYGSPCVKKDAGLSRCVAGGEPPALDATPENRYLRPIRVNDDVKGVLVAYGFSASRDADTVVSTLLAVYANFLAILDDNEHDPLTGLLNRKTFDSELSVLLTQVEDEAGGVAPEKDRRVKKDSLYHWVGVLDIDHFKKINDNHGHVYGDEVLLVFADLLRQSFRSSDLLFRYGGEEFVVVLSPMQQSEAYGVFERFRRDLEKFRFPRVGKVTVSIGMVSIGADEHHSTILDKADKALYHAKENGRNQVCNYHELVAVGLLVPSGQGKKPA